MGRIMSSIAAAFGLFSRIPVPQVPWTRDTMRYALAALPAVGAVQGAVCVLWGAAAAASGLPPMLVAAGLLLIPLLVNGGIHLDGFADTSDARASHAERARKLEIMADPHIGAFGSMAVAAYLIVLFAVISCYPAGAAPLAVMPGVFVLSRCLSALAVTVWKPAKETGIARTLSDDAATRQVAAVLAVLAVLAAAWMAAWGGVPGAVSAASALLAFAWYRHMAMAEFGGVSGDLAGWFIQVAELTMLAVFIIGSVVA